MNSKKQTRREFIKTTSGALVAIGAAASCAQAVRKEGRVGDSSQPASKSQKMPKRVLRRTRLSVSFLGFAVFHLRDAAIYRRAVHLGISYFHTVVDSNTRKLLAPDEYNLDAFAALRPFRDRIVVSHMTVDRSSKSAMLKDLDGFLQQSGFGHLDIWYVCCPSPEQLNDFSEAVAAARKGGKACWAAMSTHRVAQDLGRLTALDSPSDVVMLTYNFLSPLEDRERLGKLHAAGLGIVPMKPLAGRFYEKTTDKPDALIRWLAADSRVHSIPVGMTTVEQVEQNVMALQHPLSDEDRNVLKAQVAYTSPRFCRMCGACDGRCPQGLAISDLVRTAMYAEGYGDLHLARDHFAAIPAAQRRTSCQDCQACSVHCPNGVAIRDRIRRVQELLA